jgi:hypothetical protein
MAIYRFAVGTHALLYSGLLWMGWKILWTIKGCKLLNPFNCYV